MFSRLVGFILIALLAVRIEADQRQSYQVTTVTRTSTTKITRFTTVTSRTRTVCVKLVNATSACRRKRQFWIDTPVVLALDEEMDSFAQQFLNPSQVMSVQTTQMPTLKEEAFDTEQVNVAPIRSSVVRPSAPEQFYNPYMSRDGVVAFRPFRPFRPAYIVNPYGISPYGMIPEARLGTVSLDLSARRPGTTTKTKTITVTTLVSRTSFVTTTGTLMVSGCSPDCLTFSTCRLSV